MIPTTEPTAAPTVIDPDRDRVRVAYHEAGHATLARLVGHRSIKARLFPAPDRPGGWAGEVQTRFPSWPPRRSPLGAGDEVAILVAGSCAEAIQRGESDPAAAALEAIAAARDLPGDAGLDAREIDRIKAMPAGAGLDVPAIARAVCEELQGSWGEVEVLAVELLQTAAGRLAGEALDEYRPALTDDDPAVREIKALHRSGAIDRRTARAMLKAYRRGACRDRRGRFAPCGAGHAISQDIRHDSLPGGTRTPKPKPGETGTPSARPEPKPAPLPGDAGAAGRMPDTDPATPGYHEFTKYIREKHDAAIGGPDGLAADLGMSPDEYRSTMSARLQEVADHGELYTRIDSGTLPQVLESGRWKTQFETGTTNGSLDPGGRAQTEAEMFGTPKGLDPTHRPVYGYLSNPDYFGVGGSAHESLETYGDAVVKFKPDVRDRTTLTLGDSLGRSDMLRGMPAAGVTTDIAALDRPRWRELHGLLKDRTGGPTLTTAGLEANFGFIEAQYHGGLKVADIAEIGFQGPPGPRVRQLLQERGIPWRELPRPKG